MAQSIAIGISNASANVNHTEMAFEVARVPVTASTIDPVTRKIIFKGTDPDLGALRVYEVGLCSGLADAGEVQLITDFNGINDTWTGGTEADSTNSRVGTTLMNAAVAANTTPVTISAETSMSDMSDILGINDAWKIALHKSAATNITFTLRVYGGTGYLDIVFPATTETGYIFLKAIVNPANATAGFDVEDVTSLALIATPAAGNATACTVGYDAVIAENALSARGGDVLVARSTIAVYKTDGLAPLDIEYPFGVTL